MQNGRHTTEHHRHCCHWWCHCHCLGCHRTNKVKWQKALSNPRSWSTNYELWWTRHILYSIFHTLFTAPAPNAIVPKVNCDYHALQALICLLFMCFERLKLLSICFGWCVCVRVYFTSRPYRTTAVFTICYCSKFTRMNGDCCRTLQHRMFAHTQATNKKKKQQKTCILYQRALLSHSMT